MKILIVLILFPTILFAQNVTIDSFNKAKQALERQVYFDHRVTIYCEAEFDERKNITLRAGFYTEKYKNRINKIEWEHIVPAENFGLGFTEWREGHKNCVDNNGKPFKGRACAEKVNMEFRFMYADMYNLYPAIGAVNAARQNYDFTMLPDVENSFGSCAMKIKDRKAEPPENARGQIARTYLYMDAVYPKYKMSRQNRQLMTAWDRMYPVSEWECERYRRIKAIQGNENPIYKNVCSAEKS